MGAIESVEIGPYSLCISFPLLLRVAALGCSRKLSM
jgi:hypothetical protein